MAASTKVTVSFEELLQKAHTVKSFQQRKVIVTNLSYGWSYPTNVTINIVGYNNQNKMKLLVKVLLSMIFKVIVTKCSYNNSTLLI